MRRKIVVVDDEPDVRESLDMMLTEEGYVVSCAEDGDTFVKQLILKPDLVILDIMMPGMTTHEILSTIQRQRSMPRVIILTALRMSEDEVDNLLSYPQVLEFVEKPFDKNEFLDLIRKHSE